MLSSEKKKKKAEVNEALAYNYATKGDFLAPLFLRLILEKNFTKMFLER